MLSAVHNCVVLAPRTRKKLSTLGPSVIAPAKLRQAFRHL
jgi:hypothetical protein